MALAFSLDVVVLTRFTKVDGGNLGCCFNSCLGPCTIVLPVGLIRRFTGFLALNLQLFNGVFTKRLLLGLLKRVTFSRNIPAVLIDLPLRVI